MWKRCHAGGWHLRPSFWGGSGEHFTRLTVARHSRRQVAEPVAPAIQATETHWPAPLRVR